MDVTFCDGTGGASILIISRNSSSSSSSSSRSNSSSSSSTYMHALLYNEALISVKSIRII